MWFLIRLTLFPLKWALKILAPISLLLVAGLVGYLFFWLPDVSILVDDHPETTAFIELTRERFEREGKPGRIRQTWVELEDVSPALVEAVLIAEDDRFYFHQGFDFTELMNALEANLTANRVVRGGSTLSQQLVKNLYLSPERSYTRKINEALLTWKLEHSLSKDRILEIYLNVAEWGDGIFGVEEAARYYFRKPAADLRDREAVSLAARLPNPHAEGERPLQRRRSREKAILKRLQETQPGYRGTQRTLMASHKKKKEVHDNSLLNQKSLDRVGELVQKGIDQFLNEDSPAEEIDWKIPERVVSVPLPKEPVIPNGEPSEPSNSLEEGTQKTTSATVQTPPAAIPPAPEPKLRNQPTTDRSRRLAEKIQKIQTATVSSTSPDRESKIQKASRRNKRSRDVQERLARLEKILSEKN